MDGIDSILAGLRRAPLPPELRAVDATVLQRIDTAIAGRSVRSSLGTTLGAAAMALTIGIAAGGAPSGSGAATLKLSVFSARAALAPSTLLATGR